MSRWLRWAALIAAMAVLVAGIRPVGAQNPQTFTTMVEMPDGVKLETTVFLPAGEGPFPTLLVRTPYQHSSGTSSSEAGTPDGIASVVQHVRGRYGSEGEFGAFFDARTDGQATLNWIVAQPWSNGLVATTEGSAMGIAQYMMAPGAPGALRCQWIGVATPDLYAAAYRNGVYRSELVDHWMGEWVRAKQWITEVYAHPLNSAYWDDARITNEYGEINVVAVHVGGWYDVFARSTIDAFLGYQYEGGPGAAGHQHLIMGPWTHDVNKAKVGELTFPNDTLPGFNGMYRLWREACLLGGAAGEDAMAQLDAQPAVTYFTMGAVDEPGAPGNAWHTAEPGPPPGGSDFPLYLHAHQRLGADVPPENSPGDTFAYDPADPTPTLCGANLYLTRGTCDQRPVEQREDVIVYSTPPLEEPLEVTGDVRADIWITTDVPDTDVAVRVTDVYPDGRSMLVLDSIMRAGYHASPDFSSETLLTPGEPVQLSFDLGPTSIVFNAGHRIRISVSGANAPRFAPNPNTGASFLQEGESGQVAHTTLLHDGQHPSAIILPVR
jgi:predicted acyl esterase